MVDQDARDGMVCRSAEKIMAKKYKRPRRSTATTEEVTLFIATIPELEWSDFVEVEPGYWYPHPDAEPKIAWLKDVATIRLAEIDAYLEDEQRTLEKSGEKWVTPPLKQ